MFQLTIKIVYFTIAAQLFLVLLIDAEYMDYTGHYLFLPVTAPMCLLFEEDSSNNDLPDLERISRQHSKV